MMELFSRHALLIDLRFAIYWDGGRRGQKFPPVAFAATVVTDTPELFLRSLDARCLERVRAATRYTAYAFGGDDNTAPPLVNYEVERWFVWNLKGLGGLQREDADGDGQDGDDARLLSIRGLSAGEMETQLRMVRRRGYRDYVRVEMAVEIEAGQELRDRGRCWGEERTIVGGGSDTGS